MPNGALHTTADCASVSGVLASSDAGFAANVRSRRRSAICIVRPLDELAYALDGLTPEEIKIVKGTAK